MNSQDLLYFCVPTRKGYLQPLELPFFAFDEKDYSQQNNRQAALQALKFRNSLAYMGKEYEQLNLVCTPACDIALLRQPTLSKHCYIKTNQKTSVECYLSGRRSAILIEGSRAIRLKGCGNDFNGFEYIKGTGLRGCHFYHTAKREVFLTNLINRELQNSNKEIANKPIGFFEYDRNFINQLPKEINLKDDLKLLPKYCCIFETSGQRRAGTHLISSLQVLLANFITVDWEELKKLFVQKNRIDEGTASDTPTQWDFKNIDDSATFLGEYDQKHKDNREPLNHIDYFQIKIDKKEINEKQIEDKINALVKTYKIQQQYTTMLHQKLQKLARSGKLLDLIIILATKIGHEVGQFKRLMCEKQINWGFFNDHKIDHCNAHLNNFVVLKPKLGHELLAPLDFDLAFTKYQYIQIERDSPLYGQPDSKAFEELLMGEFTALELSLSGMELMNFQYGILKEEQIQHYKMLKCILRDSLVKYYIAGMTKKPLSNNIITAFDQNIDLLKDLVTASLIISMDFET